MTNHTDYEPRHRAIDDMLVDLAALGVSDTTESRLGAALHEIAGLAHEVPEPSAELRAVLGGAVPLRPRSRMAVVVVATGALALGGVSAAAAANRLPAPIQEVVSNATGGAVPHPVKPVNPPLDAPGQVHKPASSDPDSDSDSDASDSDETSTPSPKPTKSADTTAPGQIQKQTKPDPKAAGPARPADPGSHGRAHHDSKSDTSGSSGDDDSHGRGDSKPQSHDHSSDKSKAKPDKKSKDKKS